MYSDSKVYLFNLKLKGSIAVLINHRTKSISLLSVGARLAQLVECLTLDHTVAVSNLTRGAVLCPYARHFHLHCLVLVQPRKMSRHD